VSDDGASYQVPVGNVARTFFDPLARCEERAGKAAICGTMGARVALSGVACECKWEARWHMFHRVSRLLQPAGSARDRAAHLSR
jgi:hypothetical protein